MELHTSQRLFSTRENSRMGRHMGLESTSMQEELLIEETGEMTLRMGSGSGQPRRESGIKGSGRIIRERDPEFIVKMVITL